METLLKRLNDAGARYVVIGGQAMLQQGMPRFTLDWDDLLSSKQAVARDKDSDDILFLTIKKQNSQDA